MNATRPWATCGHGLTYVYKNTRHYIMGDLNAAVGNLTQQLRLSAFELTAHTIGRVLQNTKKDARGRWLQLLLTASDYIVINGTAKGDGTPTHFGKGKQSFIDLVI